MRIERNGEPTSTTSREMYAPQRTFTVSYPSTLGEDFILLMTPNFKNSKEEMTCYQPSSFSITGQVI
jgi:hypothetical protein